MLHHLELRPHWSPQQNHHDRCFGPEVTQATSTLAQCHGGGCASSSSVPRRTSQYSKSPPTAQDHLLTPGSESWSRPSHPWIRVLVPPFAPLDPSPGPALLTPGSESWSRPSQPWIRVLVPPFAPLDTSPGPALLSPGSQSWSQCPSLYLNHLPQITLGPLLLPH